MRDKIISDTTSIENGKVVMRYNRGDFDSLSHELKHGYQFVKGQISFKSSGQGGGLLYDLPDEQASWKRGSLFSTQLLDSLIVPSIKELREIPAYKGIQSEISLDVTSSIEMIEINQNLDLRQAEDKGKRFHEYIFSKGLDINVLNWRKK